MEASLRQGVTGGPIVTDWKTGTGYPVSDDGERDDARGRVFGSCMERMVGGVDRIE